MSRAEALAAVGVLLIAEALLLVGFWLICERDNPHVSSLSTVQARACR